MPETALADITHTIQVAVAPVFLLSAIGTMLAVLTTRLSRIIDRVRLLEARLPEDASVQTELDTLSRRARLIHRALTSSVAAAICVCLLITLAFVGYLVQLQLGGVVAVVFIAAMVLFVFALVSFLREALLSLDTVHFGRPPGARAPQQN